MSSTHRGKKVILQKFPLDSTKADTTWYRQVLTRFAAYVPPKIVGCLVGSRISQALCWFCHHRVWNSRAHQRMDLNCRRWQPTWWADDNSHPFQHDLHFKIILSKAANKFADVNIFRRGTFNATVRNVKADWKFTVLGDQIYKIRGFWQAVWNFGEVAH